MKIKRYFNLSMALIMRAINGIEFVFFGASLIFNNDPYLVRVKIQIKKDLL